MLGARVVDVFGARVAVVLVPAVVEVCCRVVVVVLARAVVEVAGAVAHAETAVALTVEDVGTEVAEPEAGAGTLPADRTEWWLDLHAPTTLTAARNATNRASRRTPPILSLTVGLAGFEPATSLPPVGSEPSRPVPPRLHSAVASGLAAWWPGGTESGKCAGAANRPSNKTGGEFGGGPCAGSPSS